MKATQIPYRNKTIHRAISAAFLIFTLFTFSSCARKLTFNISPVVPAAEGTVKIKKSKNDNYIITVKVRNLAESKRLTPPKDVYVVWMESDRNAPRNIGMVKSTSGFLSSSLKGQMQANSTIKPTAIFITAEDNGYVTYPGGLVVLRTR